MDGEPVASMEMLECGVRELATNGGLPETGRRCYSDVQKCSSITFMLLKETQFLSRGPRWDKKQEQVLQGRSTGLGI